MTVVDDAIALLGRVRASSAEAWEGLGDDKWFEVSNAVLSVTGLLAGAAAGAVVARFGSVDSPRQLTDSLADMLDRRPDLAKHLPLRKAQALARVTLGEHALAPFIADDLSLENAVALLLLIADDLAMADQAVSGLIHEAMDRARSSALVDTQDS